jgi:ABC-type nitrate/sulfonate/bicarbonate transport systems, periplasmic components
MLITLAGTLALIGLVAGAYYFAMRPVTLRIAVGPTNSDDVKVIQTMAQVFARQHESVRLRPVLTDSANASATAIKDETADLAVVRGDLDIPKNAQAVATLRKNVVMLLVPSQPAADPAAQGADPKITGVSQLAGRRIGVIGRTQANVKLLNVILRQYGIEPDKVTVVQFAPPEVTDAIRNHKADAYLGGRSDRWPTDLGNHRGGAARCRFADVPADRCCRCHRDKTIRFTRRRRFPQVFSVARRRVHRTRSRPSVSRTTSWHATTSPKSRWRT